ncbi:MAG: N-acetylneuraminate synthase family protein [Kiritimatiellae bacterium]|nr:N-acetylneuraminate synthase family protein [Kiritimatiellia bacterium]
MKKRPYIVAEIGGNHNGDVELGKRMIAEAKKCGADAVKFQLYRRCDLWTEDHLKELDNGVVKLENVPEWTTRELGLNNIFEQIDRFAVQEQEHIEFFDCARNVGIDYGTSTFTKRDVDFCIDQKVTNLKVASCDATNLDLIEYVISKDYPVHIALGMISMDEIREVVNLIPKGCRHNVTLLHCVSLYPPKDSQINLRFMDTLRHEFGMAVGYSDHTLGYAVPLAAAALGASVIEKHFTLDKNMPGWDHRVSANPEEMRIICEMSKRISDSLGDGIKVLCEDEIAKRHKFMRTIATARPIKAGTEIVYEDLVFKRPGTGICASKYRELIGRKLVRDVEADKTLFWEDVQK